jgi:iron complex transport system substrate-binding protein
LRNFATKAVMKKIKTLCHYLYLFLFCFLFACNTQKNEKQNLANQVDSLQLRYAEGFAISYHKGYKLVRVLQTGMKTQQILQYALVPRKQAQAEKLPENLPKNAQIIEIPLQSIVCLSTTHAALLDVIGEIDKITGFADLPYSAVKTLQAQAKAGKTKDVGGQNGNPNTELILSLKPDAIMGYAENDYYKFTKFGQKVLINTEYLENSALGRAEWVKFAAAFFDKEAVAEKYFAEVEKNYINLQATVTEEINKKAALKQAKPTVFGTIPYSNIWYMPAGNSFAAKLWQDAGAAYAWAGSEGTGSLQLSVEEVVSKAMEADIWLNVGNINTLQELRATDIRFANFKSLKTKQIYNCDKRKTQGGGSEFFEQGVVRPDIVLADLVKILYPELLPHHELYFYRQLQ